MFNQKKTKGIYTETQRQLNTNKFKQVAIGFNLGSH